MVVCGAELFTGNCLLVSPAVYGHIKWRGLLKNWGIVYLGNLLGSVLIAVLVVYSHSMNDAAALACVSAAAVKSELDFFDCFLRGILCNMLVCLAVWAAMASKSTGGKILAVYLPVLAFVVCGFEHSVANMYYITSGLLTAAEYGIESSLTLGNALLFCLLPSTLGNIIGGSMISLLYGYIGFGKVRRNEHDGVAKNENVNTVASEAPQSRTNQMFDKPNV